MKLEIQVLARDRYTYVTGNNPVNVIPKPTPLDNWISNDKTQI